MNTIPYEDSPSRPLTLVFGASGYIGSNLVPELLRIGRRVRATARNIEVLEGRGWAGVELARADALDPAGTDARIKCNLWGGWPTEPKAGKCTVLLELLDELGEIDVAMTVDELHAWTFWATEGRSRAKEYASGDSTSACRPRVLRSSA